LLFFHHATAREAARALDVSEHAVSAWLRGKRRPNRGCPEARRTS
jgi:predicted transcriptional regulator